MLLQAAQDLPTSTKVGEWLGGPLLICIGAWLVFRARRIEGTAVVDGTSRKHVIGIVLIFVGAAIFIVHVLQVVSSDREDADGALSDLAARSLEHSLTAPFAIKGKAGAMSIEASFAGDSASGRMRTGDEIMDFVRAGDDLYVTGNVVFWSSALGDQGDAQRLINMLDGGWLRTDLHDPSFSGITQMVDGPTFLKQVVPVDDARYVEGESLMIQGVECLALKGTGSGVVYIDEAQLRIMRLVDSQGNAADLTYRDVETKDAPKKFVDLRE